MKKIIVATLLLVSQCIPIFAMTKDEKAPNSVVCFICRTVPEAIKKSAKKEPLMTSKKEYEKDWQAVLEDSMSFPDYVDKHEMRINCEFLLLHRQQIEKIVGKKQISVPGNLPTYCSDDACYQVTPCLEHVEQK